MHYHYRGKNYTSTIDLEADRDSDVNSVTSSATNFIMAKKAIPTSTGGYVIYPNELTEEEMILSDSIWYSSKANGYNGIVEDTGPNSLTSLVSSEIEEYTNVFGYNHSYINNTRFAILVEGLAETTATQNIKYDGANTVSINVVAGDSELVIAEKLKNALVANGVQGVEVLYSYEKLQATVVYDDSDFTLPIPSTSSENGIQFYHADNILKDFDVVFYTAPTYTLPTPTNGYKQYTFSGSRSENLDFLNLLSTQTPTVLTSALYGKIIGTNQTVVVECFVKMPDSAFDSEYENFTFTLQSDDGGLLWIDKLAQEIDSDNWLSSHLGNHPIGDTNYIAGTIRLAKGKYYKMFLAAQNPVGGGEIRLSIQSPLLDTTTVENYTYVV